MAVADEAAKPKGHEQLSSDMVEDDAAILRSQKRLHDLHITLRSLRRTLPGLFDGLIPLSTPEELYGKFSNEAANAEKSVRDFAMMMRDERTKMAFEHANDSQRMDSQDVEAWTWDDNPDWLDAGKEFGRYREESAEAKESANNAIEPVVRAALAAFSKDKNQVQTSIRDQGRRIMLELGGSANLQFELLRSSESESARAWKVVTDSKSKLAMGITEVVNAKFPSLDLRQLLDLLSSYLDVKHRPCDKCSHLLNSSGQLPFLRLPADRQDVKYKAFHQACA